MVKYRHMDNDPDAQVHWFNTYDQSLYQALIAWCEAEFGPAEEPETGVRWSFDHADHVFITDPRDATALRLRWC